SRRPRRLNRARPRVMLAWAVTSWAAAAAGGGESSSRMVSTAVDGLPTKAAPAGLSARDSGSPPSGRASVRVGTVKVWLVGPGAKVSVPETGVKSAPASAVPAAAAKDTFTVPSLPPVRTTVTVAGPAPSLTADAAAANWKTPGVKTWTFAANSEVSPLVSLVA